MEREAAPIAGQVGGITCGIARAPSLGREVTMSESALSVRFLGVRGSIPVPGPHTTAGGNTACVEVAAGDTRIILDAGSGLRALGDERMARGERHSTILLSHLHWDHVCGLP